MFFRGKKQKKKKKVFFGIFLKKKCYSKFQISNTGVFLPVKGKKKNTGQKWNFSGQKLWCRIFLEIFLSTKSEQLLQEKKKI
jgi:hypothetical protein